MRACESVNTSTYLTAMGVTKWRERDTKVRPYQVICDDTSEFAKAQSLVDAVLKLIDVRREDCEFVTEPLKGKQIVWDLRRHKVRPRTAWLVSDPLLNLLSGSEAKRALWQQICQWRAQQA